ncbi:hypothetical protein ZIOFF_009886 [Zingiber officinale]|uniref:Mei2-like C-terminal RNA recognition motif domain-containing protein n=1 Tax=Zingiber officinale TaxID=94328 RepID=A0A8J5HLH6_ZINOF|nr:hypothetical protein ZIOFF_009886 [Zingiber officinale]
MSGIFPYLMQSPELEQEGSNGWKLGNARHSPSRCFITILMLLSPMKIHPLRCASLGTIASNGLENGSLNGQRSTVCCCYNQASHADLNLSLNQFNLGAQGQGALCLHPHSLPEFHNGIANGFPCESPNLMSSLSLNVNLRSAEETDNKFLQKVGFGSLNNQYNSGEVIPRTKFFIISFFGLFTVIGVSEIGSFPLNGRSYAWDNFNFSHHPSSPVLWSNLSYVNISTHDRSQMHGHGVPRASSHMLNTVPPLHHVGSTIDSNAFLHGSLGNMGFSDIPKLHPVELASYSLFIRASRNCIDATPSHVGISSPHQRGQIFHSRNAMIMAPSSLDGSIDRIKSRRNDANSNQGDSKKKYELDIELIIRGEDPRTTLMLKNIPNKYTSKMLLAAIDELHRGTYDFFYLPIDFKNKCNVGYAFMNMTKPQHIISFYQSFNGKKWEKFNSEKVASLAYARIQGKSALVAHFQNSSLMNEDKRCRPILFHSDGPNAGDQGMNDPVVGYSIQEPFPVGLNIKSRSGRLRTANGIEEQHQGSPVSANAEASPDAAGSPSGSTKNLE